MVKRNPLEQRRSPQQQRAQKRITEILGVTASLLGEVGLDDLTTVLVAKKLGISVGSVYHYFPNKFAILYAVGERWLEEMTKVLRAIESRDLENMHIDDFVEQYCDEMLIIYRRQIGVLPLVRAMFAVPELRALDERHDEEIISGLMVSYQRLGIKKGQEELNRMGRLVLEISHAIFLVIVNQNQQRGTKSLKDLKSMLKGYLQPLVEI
jgi:AcrR family transcriptional regulator